MADIPEEYRKLWSEWEVRLLVILSFLLQIFLIMAAPLRRRDDISKWVGRLIWAAYLLADWVAAFALAMLADVIHDSSGAAAAATRCDNELIAFWAPFLLAHLGGPDTITALALEDNELWLRHLLTLGIHLIAAAYVFVLTLPKNHLLAPTLLIFLIGIGRYIERTRALYLASSLGFSRWTRRWPPHRVALHRLPMRPEEGIHGVEMVRLARKFFFTYSRLFIDGLLNFDLDRDSQSLFQSVGPHDAFGIIEVELDFAYDALYTKAAVIHSCIGYIWRAICFFSILIALAIFPPLHKCRSKPVDEAVTYVLLIGAALIEVIALVKIIFSNWMLVSDLGYLDTSTRKVFPYGPPKRPRHISQYNMLSYCLSKPTSRKTWLGSLGIEDPIQSFEFMSKARVSKNLRDFIFTELKKMSDEATDFDATRNVISRRWDEFISEPISRQELNLDGDAPVKLQELNLTESILVWHMTTDFCYYRTARLTRPTTTPDQAAAQKDVIKHISNYMFYLLIRHPLMISTEEATVREQWLATVREWLSVWAESIHYGEDDESLCNRILDKYERITDDDRSSHSPLKYACSLTFWVLKQQNWEVLLVKVWMNMLFHAASNCRGIGRHHAQRLVKGGELLTSVWFLMAHLGLTDRYERTGSLHSS